MTFNRCLSAIYSIALAAYCVISQASRAEDTREIVRASVPQGKVIENPDAVAASEAEMKNYKEVLAGANTSFEMVPIKGGKFLMGSPDSEPGRSEDEGPQHEVEVEPFFCREPLLPRQHQQHAIEQWQETGGEGSEGHG